MQVCKEEKLLCSFCGQGKQCQTVIASINNEWPQQMACQSEFRKWCPNILQNFSSIINPILKWPGSFWVAFHLFYWSFFVQKVCICFLHQVEMFPFFSFNSVCYTAFCLMTLLTQATTSNYWLQFSSDILFLDSDT